MNRVLPREWGNMEKHGQWRRKLTIFPLRSRTSESSSHIHIDDQQTKSCGSTNSSQNVRLSISLLKYVLNSLKHHLHPEKKIQSRYFNISNSLFISQENPGVGFKTTGFSYFGTKRRFTGAGGIAPTAAIFHSGSNRRLDTIRQGGGFREQCTSSVQGFTHLLLVRSWNGSRHSAQQKGVRMREMMTFFDEMEGNFFPKIGGGGWIVCV